MSIKLTRRPGSNYWWIRGTVGGRRYQESTGTADPLEAEAYRVKREGEIWRRHIHGERATVTWAQAFLSYSATNPPTGRSVDFFAALTDYFSVTPVASIDQATVDRACLKLCALDASNATKLRKVITPVRAVLRHAAKRKWCDAPILEIPKQPRARTRWLTPAEASALIEHAAEHLKPLLVFLLCTGARLSEALDLDWDDVHLHDRRARLDQKQGRYRVARLSTAAVVALADLPHRDGKVFRTDDGSPYVDRGREEGGQIKTAFSKACNRAGICKPVLGRNGKPLMRERGPGWKPVPVVEPTATPHDLRHTWATWFYALTRDLLLLKTEGDWSTTRMVERYAHLMPGDMVPQIAQVWGANHPAIGDLPATPPPPAPGRRTRRRESTEG